MLENKFAADAKLSDQELATKARDAEKSREMRAEGRYNLMRGTVIDAVQRLADTGDPEETERLEEAEERDCAIPRRPAAGSCCASARISASTSTSSLPVLP